MLYTPPTPTPSAGALVAANNLSDVASAAAARANLEVLSAAEAQAADAARAPLDYIAMDGATTNRAAGIYGPFDATVNRRGWIAGVPVLTVLFDFVVPTSNPGVTAIFYAVGGIATTGGANSMRFWLDTAGTLAIAADGSGTSRRFQYVGFRAAYSGQRVRGRVILTNGTTDPVVEVLGTDISSSFAATASATPPDWLSSALDSIFHVVGYNWPAITAPTVIPILGTLTSGAGGEAETWRLDGRLPAWVQIGGHASIYLSDFTVGASGFTGSNTIVAGNIDGINGEDDVLQFYANAGNIAHSASVPVSFARAGRYLITGRIFIPTGQTTVNQVQIFLGGDGVSAASWQVLEGTRTYNASGSWQNINLIAGAVSAYSTLGFFFNSGASFVGANSTTDDVAYLKAIKVQALGATTIPVVQPALVVGDGTLLGDNCGRILGGIPVTSRDRWRIVGRTHTAAAQDVQVLGGPLFLEANRSRIDSACAVQNSGGALNIAVGSTSGGTNIVASTEIATGSVPTELAPALRYPPTQNLFIRRVAGSGTGPFTVTLDGHRVGANP
jgi:hypothetical protein